MVGSLTGFLFFVFFILVPPCACACLNDPIATFNSFPKQGSLMLIILVSHDEPIVVSTPLPETDPVVWKRVHRR